MRASIIIPHYNMADHLDRCLDKLDQQSIPRNAFEIIVIDNGSTQKIDEALKNRVDQWQEYTAIQDPYNCRNLGIKFAKSDIVAFLDVKCSVGEKWLASGLEHFKNNKETRIIAGRFQAIHTSNDQYQLFYSLNHLNQKKKVKNNSGILTGNLFVRKSVFTNIGYFPENMRSGGDIIWSQRAKKAGLVLSYVEEAIVSYPAKSKKEILSSAIRDGRGAFYTFRGEGKSIVFHLKMILFHILPDKPARIKERIAYQKDSKIYNDNFLAMWKITWRTNLLFALGYVKGILRF